ncbi:glycine zipper 2TM domain-containing protein [Sphingomonas crusticola]|uniref:glycine zipper 2TM domain-containing protein n=1 Tax=Sphingomonas crusticola TaxID=1697973 RepID=UPI001F074A7F|nr:glycine zipper 2TM domain-containing protein [Sphingomonas crusticola]
MSTRIVAMVFKTLRLAGTAIIAATMLVPTFAGAQYYRGPAPYYQAGYSRDGYASDRDGYSRDRDGYGYDRGRRDRDRRHANRDRRDYRHCDRGTGGTILGAIAGGLLGNAAVGRRGNHTAGALAGAGVGALAGNAIDRDC